MYSADFRLDSCELDTEPTVSHYNMSVHGKFQDSSLEYTEYLKTKIQRRHLFADLAIYHLWQ
jgi:hypothetical protein